MERKPIVLLLLAATSAAILLGGWRMTRVRLDVFPSSRGLSVYAYDDRANQGNSRVLLVDAEPSEPTPALRMAFRLGDAYPYPYCGLGLFVPDSSGRQHPLDLSGYDSLVFEARGRQSTDIRVNIKTVDPAYTDRQIPVSFVFLEGGAPVDRRWARTSLALSDFSIPAWWYELNHIAPRPGGKHFDRTAMVEFLNSPRLAPGVVDTLEVRSIAFVGTDHRPLAAAGLAVLILWAAAGISVLRRRQASAAFPAPAPPSAASASAVSGSWKPSPPAIAPLPTETEGDSGEPHFPIPESVHLPSRSQIERDILLAYLARNYHLPDLPVTRIARETGIHEKRLPQVARDAAGTTLKAHVNRLRLNEAKRLLRDTDRQVSEIAFSVGFGNIHHFNRVFKSEFGVTPSDWRIEGSGDAASPFVGGDPSPAEGTAPASDGRE